MHNNQQNTEPELTPEQNKQVQFQLQTINQSIGYCSHLEEDYEKLKGDESALEIELNTKNSMVIHHEQMASRARRTATGLTRGKAMFSAFWAKIFMLAVVMIDIAVSSQRFDAAGLVDAVTLACLASLTVLAFGHLCGSSLKDFTSVRDPDANTSRSLKYSVFGWLFSLVGLTLFVQHILVESDAGAQVITIIMYFGLSCVAAVVAYLGREGNSERRQWMATLKAENDEIAALKPICDRLISELQEATEKSRISHQKFMGAKAELAQQVRELNRISNGKAESLLRYAQEEANNVYSLYAAQKKGKSNA